MIDKINTWFHMLSFSEKPLPWYWIVVKYVCMWILQGYSWIVPLVERFRKRK